ncbi:MAG: ComF family protein [Rhodospirillaceae bacterium]|nr:ComF family protein [Rhodospirillaceae bacterium]
MTATFPLGRRLRSLGGAALDIVLPPRCLACGTTIGATGALCHACWQQVTFLEPPLCACCGWPFDYAMAEGAVCGACTATPPRFDRARAAIAYDDGSRAMVLGFKHGDQTHAAAAFAGWMARAGADLLRGDAVLAPVPLHRSRLFRRRYNQAALLAIALGRLAGCPVVPDLLVRRRRSPGQGHLSRTERRANVKGAFAVRRSAADRVAGRRIVLVDDVLTTGATAGECTATLRRAGAAAVDVLTLARVILPQTAWQ